MIPHAVALQRHYAQHHEDRALPWRRPGEPLVRVALVEGLLAMTRAATVARWYEVIFTDVTTGDGWLDLGEAERMRRVEHLGLGKKKRRAVDAIATALKEGAVLWPKAIEAYLGLGPYTAGMIGLLHGVHAAPVDTNVERVGRRAAFDNDPIRWVDQLLRAAAANGSATGRPAAYEVACAVLDIGATRCRPDRVECPCCPLSPWCASRSKLDLQAVLGVPDPQPPWRPVYVAVPIRAINVDCDDWEPREATLEAGWRVVGAAPPKAEHATRAALWALRQACPVVETGELDFGGHGAATMAQLAAGRLPGRSPWCRVVIGPGPAHTTAWGYNKRSDDEDPGD
jgi:A/G-specific adenine glycosylase